MGWTVDYNAKNTEDARRIELGIDAGWMEIVAQSGSWYVVKPGPQNVTATWKLMLITVLTQGRSAGGIATKGVSAQSGPYVYPPKSFLAKYRKMAQAEGVEPEGYEEEFYERCEAHYATLAKAKKVTEGTVIRFHEPLEFTNGDVADTFAYVSGSKFRDVRYGWGTYSITKWKTRAYDIVETEVLAA